MSAYETYTPRSFYRSADRAVLAGVCAGFSEYFGFNLRVLRVLVVIAFLVAMPMTVIGYLAAVLLIPSRSGTAGESARENMTRKERKQQRKQARRAARRQQDQAPTEAATMVRDKCRALDQRLIALEKYITSPRYQLDREIRDL